MLALGAMMLFLAQAGSVFADSTIHRAVHKVKNVGYVYGGTTTKGFDCSGFTMYLFGQLGVSLPHSSKAQATYGEKVAKDDLRLGDLVFFDTGGNGISHVGVYLDNGRFAHSASNEGITINKLSEAYYAKRYVTARRILSDQQLENIMIYPPDTNAETTVATTQTADDKET